MKNSAKNGGLTMAVNETYPANTDSAFTISFSAATEKKRPSPKSAFDDTCVLIFDGGSQNCDSISQMLSTSKGFFCSGVFRNTMGLIDKIREAQPGIVLLDVKLPDMCSVSFGETYPNPLSQSATVSFFLNELSPVIIELMDVNGRSLRIIVKKDYSAGSYEVTLNRESLGAGIYFLQLKTNAGVMMKKLVIE